MRRIKTNFMLKTPAKRDGITLWSHEALVIGSAEIGAVAGGLEVVGVGAVRLKLGSFGNLEIGGVEGARSGAVAGSSAVCWAGSGSGCGARCGVASVGGSD